uniref:Exfoliative toxin C n=1 Tax=Mammaliicoccus sciuri TaxID=1296 RepID=UPI0029677B88|nr:Chain A, Exfoliative toxin C [Mammaliicoccus sciuri]8T3I_B Chain B, Exfoliative toxin C [Mammaliicoccus sciuri]
MDEESDLKDHRDKWNKYYGVSPDQLSKDLFDKVSPEQIKNSPYQSVGALFVKGEAVATGVFIGKNTVVTNHHIAKEAKNNPSKIIFSPGAHADESNTGTVLPHGTFEASEIIDAPFGTGVDISVIIFKPNAEGKSIGDVIKAADLGNSNSLKKGDTANLIGYPYDFDSKNMYRSQVEFQSTDFGLKYYGYTVPGNSGSGIFNSEGKFVGLHIGKAKHINSQNEINYAVSFNDFLIRDLKQLIKGGENLYFQSHHHHHH